ncbi:MAG TPA: STAS domain-containing protein [Solirubrobacteraceae bacterium]
MTSANPYLTIEVTSGPKSQTIVLTGEADLLGAPKIEAALKDICAEESELVVIDLRSLTFIDSSGLHALMTGHAQCVAQGKELKVIPGPAPVQRLFEIAGMDEILPFTDAADLDIQAPHQAATPRTPRSSP